MAERPDALGYRTRLRLLLVQKFSEEELRSLCSDLDVPYDPLPGRGMEAKARELIAHLEHRDRLAELVGVGRKLRPDVLWPERAGDTGKDIGWHASLAQYLAHLQALHSTIRVLGSPKPVPLEGIFTDLFILDRPTASRLFDLRQLREDPGLLERAERVDGLQLVTQGDEKRLFILGKPGAGKTTFLRYLTLQAAEGKLDRVPILVSLREWSDVGQELMPYLARQFEACGFPDAGLFVEHALDAGQALVLFDGLDEVNHEGGGRERIIAALRDFSRHYLNSQCLITCRVAATEYQFERFTYVEIADFTDRQMEAYARKWFAHSLTKRDRFLADFARPEHRGLRELGQSPLLLSMLCLAFDETMRFPQRRVDAYKEALDALLKKWDAARGIRRDEIYRRLSPERKLHMLARIAAETFEAGEVFLRQEALEGRIAAYLRNLPPADAQDQMIDGEAVLRAIEAQHCILVERAHRIHSFSHRTLQEYFTAKYIVDNAARGTLKRLIDHHMTDDHWHEVFIMTASMLDDADRFFARFQKALEGMVAKDREIVEMLSWAAVAAREVGGEPVAIRSLYLYFDLARAHSRALSRDLTLAHTLSRPRSLARDISRVLSRQRSLDLRQALDHDLGSADNPDFAHVLDRTHGLTLDKAGIELLADYLGACRLYVDCLEVAYVSDREALRDRLLRAPETGVPATDRAENG